MPKVKDISTTQFYKVFALLDEHDEVGLSAYEVSKMTGFPMPSVRRVLSELTSVGKVESKMVYRLK